MLRGLMAAIASLAFLPSAYADPMESRADVMSMLAAGAVPGDHRSGSATSWTPPRGAYFARSGKAKWKRARRVRG